MKTSLTLDGPVLSRRRCGMTLIELTVVILVLLSLITILFIGARAWKRGSDRAGCMINIRQVQVAVRSLANINDLKSGQDAAPFDVEGELVGSGKFVESPPNCPAAGTYTLGGTMIPAVGDLYMTCSLAASHDHEPDDYSGW